MNPARTTPPSREEIAQREIGVTAVSPRLARALAVVFLAVIALVPAAQWLRAGRGPSLRRVTAGLPAAWRAARGSWPRRVLAANRALLREMTAYERRLEDASWLAGVVRPPAQWALLKIFGVGNEKVYRGRDHWLFYRPEIELLTGPGFLEPAALRRRAAAAPEWRAPPAADPTPAILDFHEQLRRRGIELIVVPVPVKPSIHPERFLRAGALFDRLVENISMAALVGDLRRRGVSVWDPAPLLWAMARGGAEAYLATDTHWRPEAMERVAEALARRLAPALGAAAPRYRRGAEPLENTGDLVRMLTLPPGAAIAPEGVNLHPVFTARNELWRAEESAAVLVLGDSFCNIYSLPAMGWGSGAGFVEQLSFFLNEPVDRLVRNDDGAHATRRLLARELARGRDRLAGKRAVLWLFSARELAQGDWPLIPLEKGERPPSRLVQVPTGVEWVVTGQVDAVSAVPRPGTTPYRDHILSAHLRDLVGVPGLAEGEGEALVHAWSLRDHRPTAAAFWRAGQEVRVRLRSWSDAGGELEAVNRSELEDEDLRLEEPCWADPAE